MARPVTHQADPAGQWQGEFLTSRIVFRIAKAAKGYKTGYYVLGESPTPIDVDTTTVAGSTIKLTLVGIIFTGKMTADGQHIRGSFSDDPTIVDLSRTTPATAWPIDPSPHRVQFITTDDHVKLEVVDWGGNGPPLVFIPGLGADAHFADKFAPRFTNHRHVYAISRRGFGASDHPDPAKGADYSADRLADDVLSVLAALKIERPVLAGWSIGGEELSSIGSRAPEKVAGLIYLDAGYAYAFYAPGNRAWGDYNLTIAGNDIHAKLKRLQAGDAQTAQAIIDTLLNQDLPQLETDLKAKRDELVASPGLHRPRFPAGPDTLRNRIPAAVAASTQKYTALKAPILAIYAYPPVTPPGATAAERAEYDAQRPKAAALIDRFEAGNPKAKVVRIANARHDIFNSNADQVAREMDAFMNGLK